MNRIGLAAIAAALALATGPGCAGRVLIPQPPATVLPQAVADELFAVDRALAARSAGAPAGPALAEALDDDVIMFIVPFPRLAQGRDAVKQLLDKGFPGGTSAVWSPIRVGVSADGTHGFSYGFMDRNTAGGKPLLGKYVAYWVKRPRGWRIAAFKLVPRPDGPISTEVRPPALPTRLVPIEDSPARIASYRAELDRTERAFSDASQVTSLGAAFKLYGSADAMNVGAGPDFTYGNVAIGEAQGGDAPAPSPLRWAPDSVLVASSGDLGVTWGYLKRNGPTPPGRLAEIPFFTIWRRTSPSEPWLYVAE